MGAGIAASPHCAERRFAGVPEVVAPCGVSPSRSWRTSSGVASLKALLLHQELFPRRVRPAPSRAPFVSSGSAVARPTSRRACARWKLAGPLRDRGGPTPWEVELCSGCLRPAGSGRDPEGSTSLCLGEPSTRPARTCIPSAPSLPFRGPSWDGASCRGPDRSLRTRPALRREEDPSLPAPLASLAPEVLRSVQPRTFEDAANRREPFFFHRLAGGDRWLSPLPVRPVSGAAPVEAAAPDHLEKMTRNPSRAKRIRQRGACG